MKFDTIKEEKRIFERFKWCIEKLLNVKIEGVHLSKINSYSPFDFHTSIKYNGWSKIGLTEIRFTNNDINEQESYISLSKKNKVIDFNPENNHRIFVEEYQDGLYVADLTRANWTKIGSSRFSKEACYFNKEFTPHLVIPLLRTNELSFLAEYDLKGYLVKEYGNIRSVRGKLMDMTNSI